MNARAKKSQGLLLDRRVLRKRAGACGAGITSDYELMPMPAIGTSRDVIGVLDVVCEWLWVLDSLADAEDAEGAIGSKLRMDLLLAIGDVRDALRSGAVQRRGRDTSETRELVLRFLARKLGNGDHPKNGGFDYLDGGRLMRAVVDPGTDGQTEAAAR
ncbi:MAG: hypothetical protein WEF50_11135 [Myxococcota bacterium]